VAGDINTYRHTHQSIDTPLLPAKNKPHSQKIFCYSSVLNLWTRNENQDQNEHISEDRRVI